MGSWYRSEEMEYVEVMMGEDAAHACVREMGKLGCIQFTDMEPEKTPFQRRYVAYIKRCDEIERKIRYFHTQIGKLGIPVQQAGTVDEFMAAHALAGKDSQATGTYLLDTLETKLQGFENQLLELGTYAERLTTEYNHKLEYQLVLNKARTVFLSEVPTLEAVQSSSSSPQDNRPPQGLGAPLLSDEVAAERAEQRELRFSHITGVLRAQDRARFERMLFRATRGNCFVRFADVEEPLIDPKTSEPRQAVVFVILFKSQSIENRIKRICDAFEAHRHHVESLDDGALLDSLQQQNFMELESSKVVLNRNTETRQRLCSELSQHVEEWLWIVRREKAVYHTLNLFKTDVSHVMRAHGWILKDSVDEARTALDRAHASLSLPNTAVVQPVLGKTPTPPTYFRTNKFTSAFQEFVDTYGVPRYREINPALYTAATFPFLFGVMYGDIGHGFCLFIAGLYMVLTEYKAEARTTGEFMRGMYSARYMILLMGMFSIYCGVIYNDYFALGLDIFKTRWHWEHKEDGEEAVYKSGEFGDPSNVYPVGVDPIWHISSNDLLFLNSLKMKLSVILGITQMCFGVVLRGLNAVYFRSYLDLYTEVLPMIVFAVAFFGYMVFIIFMKWTINWDYRMLQASCINGFRGNSNEPCTPEDSVADLCPYDYGGEGDGCQPPNLITTLVNMVLTPGTVDEPMYEGQANVQVALLLIAFISVPVLLLAKPMYLKYCGQRPKTDNSVQSDTMLMADEHEGAVAGDHDDEHDDHGGFGEIMVHQAIETIEFVLGMVSNTASYLRLWALSLAHGQLAKVFWDKAMLDMIKTNNAGMVFVGYAIYAAVTIGVLLLMDVLECFLHALRLHWVEFQNKFYKADGYKFQPFSIRNILKNSTFDQ